MIVPNGKRLLVKAEAIKDTLTKAGIWLSKDTVENQLEDLRKGKVVSAGTDCSATTGMTIWFSKYSVCRIPETEDLLIVADDDVMAMEQ